MPWEPPTGPPVLSWTAPVVLSDGSVVMLMFASDGAAVLSTHRLARFDPSSEQWSPLCEVPGSTGSIACGAHGLAALSDGRLAVLPDHGPLLLGYGHIWRDGPVLANVRGIHTSSQGAVLADLGDTWSFLRR